MKKSTMLALGALLLTVMSANAATGKQWNFSAVCPSGQTLYYKILSDTTVGVTYPGYFTSQGDCFYKDYTRPSGDLVIPGKVSYEGKEYYISTIETYAFEHCSGLTSVTFPENGVFSTIGMSCFYECYLEQHDLVFPSTTKNINSNAFVGNGFVTVTIPESVTFISDCVWWNNYSLTTFTLNARALTSMGTSYSPGFVQGVSNLKTINIGPEVTNIPAYAFSYTTSISEINCAATTPPTIYSTTFANIDKGIRIRVPCEAVSAYKDNGLWGSFTDIKGDTDCSASLLTINVSSNDLDMGTVSGGGKYEFGTQVTLEAFPNSGYDFIRWSNGKKYNPYKFTAKEDMDVVAIFQQIEADVVNVDGVQVTPSDNSANIEWPKVTNAVTYTLIIWADASKTEKICALTFNASGVVTGLEFFAPSRHAPEQKAQEKGFSFTVTGLDSGTDYYFNIVSADKDGNPLKTESGSFKTTGVATGIEEVAGNAKSTKILKEGQLLIRRGDQMYSTDGQRITDKP